MFHVNLFATGATFETEPVGEASVPVKVDERAAKTLAALLALESFELAHAIAQVFLAGVTVGKRTVPTDADIAHERLV